MGILNTTPDSFSDGGQFDSRATARAHAVRLMQEGADIIDIGGESTRPGADLIAVDEEISRTKPAILDVRQASPLPLSIDTRKAPVAAAALDAGIDWINDVSALTFDSEMARLAASSGAPVCLMHAPSDPKTMQQNAQYEDVLLDVYDYLAARVDFALSQGILRQNIIVDPGIGFGKTLAHNLTLLRGLAVFHSLGCLVLLGASRKRFIGRFRALRRPKTAWLARSLWHWLLLGKARRSCACMTCVKRYRRSNFGQLFAAEYATQDIRLNNRPTQ
jgi:dihydropteroate synthase